LRDLSRIERPKQAAPTIYARTLEGSRSRWLASHGERSGLGRIDLLTRKAGTQQDCSQNIRPWAITLPAPVYEADRGTMVLTDMLRKFRIPPIHQEAASGTKRHSESTLSGRFLSRRSGCVPAPVGNWLSRSRRRKDRLPSGDCYGMSSSCYCHDAHGGHGHDGPGGSARAGTGPKAHGMLTLIQERCAHFRATYA
jgi:hypothetical protein